MANEIEQLSQDLRNAEQAAEAAKNKIGQLTAQIEKLLAASAKGGVPTQERLTQVAQELATGQREATGRVRLGGRSQASLKRLADAIDLYIQEYVKANEEFIKAQAVLNSPKAVAYRSLSQIPVPAQPTQQGGLRGTPPAQGVPSSTGTQQGWQIPAHLQRFTELTKVLEQAQRFLGATIEKAVYPRVSELADGISKLSIAFKSGETSTGRYTLYIDELGNSITETEYKAAEAAKKEEARAAKRAARATEKIASRDVYLEQLSQKYPNIGDTVRKRIEELGAEAAFPVEKANISVQELADGFAKLTISVSEGMVQFKPAISYIDQLGNILDETAYKAEKAAAKIKIYSAKDLQEMLGAVRYQAAMTKASQYGFGAENLKKQYTQQPTGVTFMTFERETERGLEKMGLTVDKFGKVLTQTNKRLLDFFSAIAQNTAQVIRWSIGATAVYQALFKLQDLVRVAIDNESRLADITVTLGNNQRNVNEIFEDASRIAVETGESINGVLEAYTLAYRAVGAVEDPIRRTAAANKLLTDSIILSKLSALDEAESIDVLAGAIRQLQQPGESFEQSLERGTKLLDQWVAVTRVANVDLATLATAFSITAESADNAGVSTEELTAIIASISEKIGGLGGRETGNAVRALIGGVYQGKAGETLGNYGIAIEDVNGKMRDWLDIMREIAGFNEQELISSDQLNKIAYVLGGGVRRGQQYVAVLGDIGRVDELVAYQSNVAGAAQEALARKLDTVQTSVTNLGNAFQKLAQTLGSEGGILDTSKGLLDVFTGILNIVSELTKVLGKLTVPAALLAFGAAYFRGPTGALKKQDFLSGLGGIVGGLATGVLGAVPGQKLTPEGKTPLAPYNQQGMLFAPGLGGEYTRAELAGQRAGAFGQKYGLGIALGAMPAISRAGQGEWGAAGADIAGAIIGTLVAGGNPIGGVIGAAIAETFVSETLTYEPEFRNIFKPIFGTEPDKELDTETKTDREQIAEQQKELTRQLFEDLGGIFGEGLGKLRARAGAFGTNLFMGAYGVQQRALGKEFRYEGIDAERFALAQPALWNPFGKIPQETLDTIGQFAELSKQTPVEIQLPKLVVSEEEKGIIRDIQDNLRTSQLEALFKRDIKPREYSDTEQKIQGLISRLPAMENAFGDAFDAIRDDINSTADLYEVFSEIITESSTEDTERINQLVTQINVLERGIKGLQETGQAFTAGVDFAGLPIDYNLENIDEAKTKVSELRNELVNLVQGLSREITIQKIELPQVIKLDTRVEYVDKIQAEAEKLEAEFLSALTVDERTKYEAEKSLADTLIEVWMKGGQAFYERVAAGGPAAQFYQQAFQNLTSKGEVPEISQQGLPLRNVNATYPQLMGALSGYEPLMRQLEAAGYQRDEQYEVAILKDGVVTPMQKDWKVVQLLLQDILDVNKKQLEGVYNLPADASFYVPFQGYKLGFGQDGGAGGVNWQVLPGEMEDGTYRGAKEGVREGIRESRLRREDESPFLKERPTHRGYEREFTSPILRERYGYIPGKEKAPEVEYTPFSMAALERKIEPPLPGFGDYITGDILTRAIDKSITSLSSLLEPKFDALINAVQNLPEQLNKIFKTPTVGQMEGDVSQTMLASLKTEMPKVENKLSLNINTTAQLMVDGRLMASVVKQYLYEDLLRGSGISGSNSMSITI